MESVIVKTGVLKLADRGTKTKTSPLIKKKRIQVQSRHPVKTLRGVRWVKGATQGPGRTRLQFGIQLQDQAKKAPVKKEHK